MTKLERIIVPNNRGFCGGVEVAIRAVEDLALKHPGETIYLNHPIIHNGPEVERLEKEYGVVTVESISEVPDEARVIFSAHGSHPDVYAEAERRGIKFTDATCFLVNKVHSRAIDYARMGYEIVLIGHEGHQEVIGTMGRASMHLVESVEKVRDLNIPPGRKVAYITQTTLSKRETREIEEELKARFKTDLVTARDDICYATTNRQEAVQAIIDKFGIDAFLVVGGNTSSNVKELVNTAKERNVRVYLIETSDDITNDYLEGVRNLGLTSGASTPERLVEGVIGHLQSNYGGTLERYFHKAENVHFPPIELN